MTTQRTVTDIPADKVDQVVEDFESEGCSAVKSQQSDNKWTVVATCPDS